MPPVAAAAAAIGSAAAGAAAVAAPVVGAIASAAPVVAAAATGIKTLVDVIGDKQSTPIQPATTAAQATATTAAPATVDTSKQEEAIAEAKKISGQLSDVLQQQAAGVQQPIVYTTPSTAAPNYLPYIGIAGIVILAIILLRKK